MGVMDEVAEAQETSRVVRCRVCAYLIGLPAEEREEWATVMDSDYQHEAIAKVLRRNGVEIAGQAVGLHRRSERCYRRVNGVRTA